MDKGNNQRRTNRQREQPADKRVSRHDRQINAREIVTDEARTARDGATVVIVGLRWKLVIHQRDDYVNSVFSKNFREEKI